ncbi:ATP-dependent Zn protease [Hoeflea sp. EC-HK425]|uniref:ATP-dependent Zn protease n=1 Tax=Hoeflea sp. EC-HK425 TaxID=2038388 RepID=UPI001256000F|nr:ATP-dependent Zn protease [Hoeflea sp. EC-HK425]VVS98498.1 ATP-dependent Zn protease [Hoeflea sp. EC-HK425]
MADSNTALNAPDVMISALKPLALSAAGRTGADIERLIREARQKARRERRNLTYSDIHAALTADQAGLSPELIWRFAVHESGHALARTLLGIGSVLTMSVGNGFGGFVESERSANVIENGDWVQKQIACKLAGRAAEKLIFGDMVIGSGGVEQSDLARATKLALDAETAFGLGQVHPLLYRSADPQMSILSLDRELARNVNSRLEAAEALAMGLLSQNHDALLALATRLADVKVLDGAEVRDLLDRHLTSSTNESSNAAS